MSVSEEAFKAAAQYVLSLRNLGVFVGFETHANIARLRELVSDRLPDAALDVLTAPYRSVQYLNVDAGISFVIVRAITTLPGATRGRRKHSLRRAYRRYCQRKGWEVPGWLLGPKQWREQYAPHSARTPYIACALP